MNKFDIGDRVQLKGSLNTGVIKKGGPTYFVVEVDHTGTLFHYSHSELNLVTKSANKFKVGDKFKILVSGPSHTILIAGDIVTLVSDILPNNSWMEVRRDSDGMKAFILKNESHTYELLDTLKSFTNPNRTISMPPGYTVNINGKTLTTNPPVVDTPVPQRQTFVPSFDPFTSMYGADDGSVYSGNSWESEITKCKPKCECGTTKTYGESAQPELHSSFCPLRKA